MEKLLKIWIFILFCIFSNKISIAENLNKKMIIVSTNLCIDWLILDYLNTNKNHNKNNIFVLSPLINKVENQGNYLQWKHIISKLKKHNGTLESIIQNIKFQPHIILTGKYDNPLLKNRLQRLNFTILTLNFPQKVLQIISYQAEFEKIIGEKNTIENSQYYYQFLKNIQQDKQKKTLLLLGANEIAFANNTLENDILNYTQKWKNYLPKNVDGYVSINKEMLIKNPPNGIIFLASNFNKQQNSLATTIFHENFKKFFSSNKNSLEISYKNSNENSKNFWQWQCPGKWSFELIKNLDNYE